MYCKNFPHIKCLSDSILMVEWHSITWYILWFLTLLVEYLSCLCFGGYLIILSSGHGEGNATPLQYSCLENPMDRGAWWAAVHGVAQSRTWPSDFTLTFPFMHWRRKWQPTPVFLPGESQGQGSLVGCRLWGRTESDTTKAPEQQQQQQQC